MAGVQSYHVIWFPKCNKDELAHLGTFATQAAASAWLEKTLDVKDLAPFTVDESDENALTPFQLTSYEGRTLIATTFVDAVRRLGVKIDHANCWLKSVPYILVVATTHSADDTVSTIAAEAAI